MVDIHIHVIPDIDDGSDNLEESLNMLRLAAAQGVTSVIATPHSSAFDFGYDKVRKEYAGLLSAVSEERIPVRILLGAEILCYESDMDEIIHYLQMGIYPTLNNTRYVLAEFFPNASKKAIEYCLYRLIEAEYIPVLAHAERYHNFDLESADRLHREGVLIQMNVYSVREESYDRIKKRVRKLLDQQLVDFAGSDAHGMQHRPPSYTPGMEYMYGNYEHTYVDKILQDNAVTLLHA